MLRYVTSLLSLQTLSRLATYRNCPSRAVFPLEVKKRRAIRVARCNKNFANASQNRKLRKSHLNISNGAVYPMSETQVFVALIIAILPAFLALRLGVALYK